jgi:hypothetical protein
MLISNRTQSNSLKSCLLAISHFFQDGAPYGRQPNAGIVLGPRRLGTGPRISPSLDFLVARPAFGRASVDLSHLEAVLAILRNNKNVSARLTAASIRIVIVNFGTTQPLYQQLDKMFLALELRRNDIPRFYVRRILRRGRQNDDRRAQDAHICRVVAGKGSGSAP